MRKNKSDIPPVLATLKVSIDALPDTLRDRLNNCPKLASLHSIYDALGSLVESDHAYLSQIAELIGRDPPLTSRLLKLVNSVFYGMDQPCVNIEEATLAAGLDQISELILSTPVIEDLQTLQQDSSTVDWTEFWRHCIATAILTREVYSLSGENNRGDADYIAGLIHNVGKIILALVFPEEFEILATQSPANAREESNHEVDLMGTDHATIGAHYLHAHKIPVQIIEATLCHDEPGNATLKPKLAASVQVASHLARLAQVPGIEGLPPPHWKDVEKLDGWQLLFANEPNPDHIKSSMEPTLDRLKFFLSSMV